MKKIFTHFREKLISRFSILTSLVISALLVVAPTFISESYAYTGDARLYLTTDGEGTLAPGEEKEITIRLDTTNLDLDSGENIQTVGTYLSFPNNLVEVIGDLNFSGSAFSSPFKGTYDNSNGSIDIVRTRDANTNLSENALIGTFTIRAKSDASDSVAEIRYVSGQNTVLLNDIDSSNVLTSWEGMDITIGVGGDSQSGNPEIEENNGGQSANPIKDATIRVVPQKTALSVGETIPVQIRMNTGSATNSVSFAEINLSYPTNLHITENTVDISSGVFHNATVNTVNDAQGKINLQLLANSSIQSSDALIGTFYVEKIASGDATINILGDSILEADDVDNTNVLLIAGSAGTTFTGAGPMVTASINPDSILETESTTITFQSTETGTFHVRPHDCTSLDSLATGTVSAADTDQQVTVEGEDVGAGEDQRMVVCVTNSENAVGQSNNLLLDVGVVETPADPPEVKVCSLTPGTISTTGSSTLTFITDKARDLRIKKGNCDGSTVPFFVNGSRLTSMSITSTATECSGNTNNVDIPAESLGGEASYSLSVCVTDDEGTGYATTSLTVSNGGNTTTPTPDPDPIKPEDLGGNITGGGSSGGGDGGWRRTPDGEIHTSSQGACQTPTNFRVESLNNGKFLIQWDKITDERVEKLMLNWGTSSRNLTENIELPNITKITFPGKDFTIGKTYYFALSSLGNCDEKISNEASAVKQGDNESAIGGPSEPEKEYKAPPKTSGSGPELTWIFLATGGVMFLVARRMRKNYE